MGEVIETSSLGSGGRTFDKAALALGIAPDLMETIRECNSVSQTVVFGTPARSLRDVLRLARRAQ